MKITAKRFLALFLALTMMLSSFAFAEEPVQPETVPENTEQVIEQQPTENVVVDNTTPEVTGEQQVEPAAEVPQGETAEVEQQVEPAAEVPQAEPATEVLQVEPEAEAPQEEPAADVPQEEPAAEVPQEEPVTDVPQEEPAAEVPQEEPVTDVSQEEPVVDVPQEEPAAVVPQEEPAADVPQGEPAADVPQEQPAADVPQGEPAADVPQEQPAADVPQEEPAADVPEEEPAADVPQEEPVTDVPQEEPAEVPQEAPATDMPQEEPAADEPQEEPVAEVPQGEPAIDVPQEEPTVESGEVQPEEPVTESTDDVVQVSVAKTLAIGDEWTGSIISGNELAARLEASAGKVHILAEGNDLYISVVKEEEADGADNKQYADAEGKIDYSWNADNANYIIYVGMKDYQSGAFKLQVLSDQTYTALKEAEAAAQLAAEVNEKTEDEPAVPDEVIEQEEEPSTDIIEEELQETEPSAPVGEENEQEEVPVDTTDEKETEPSVPVSEEKGQEEVPVDTTDEKETKPSVPVSEEKGQEAEPVDTTERKEQDVTEPVVPTEEVEQEEEPIDIHPRAAVSNETPAIGETITLTAVADVEIEEIAIWYTSPTGVEGSWERFAYGNEVYVKIDEGNSNNYFRFKLSDEIYSESVGIRATKSIQGGESKALKGTRGLVTYTISFDLNGGTGVEGAYSDQTIAQGKMAAKPADPTKDGSIFAGWYSSDDLFDFNKPVTSTCVLKAKWLRKVIVKFYTDQQETTEWNIKEIAEGEKVTAPDPAPTKTKYMLVGWNDSNGTAFDFDTPINEDLNLYAVWEEEIWSIGDISEGGSKNETGDVVTFTECMIRKGVSLDDTNDKDRYWADIKVVAPKSVTAENIDKVVISFDGTNWDHRSFAGISQLENNNNNYTIILSLEIVAATLLKKASEHATIETSYWFAWESETEAAQKFTIAINPQNIELKDGDSRVLKIQDWKEVHTVTFSHDGSSLIDPVDVLDGDSVRQPSAVPQKENYIFRAWQLDGEDYDFDTAVYNDIELSADWVPVVAKIGDEPYASLKEAVAAVPADGTTTTIQMIDDETIDVTGYAVTIGAGQNVILDLNGKTVTGTCATGKTSVLILNKGELTITDSSSSTGRMEYIPDPAWVYSEADPGGYASNLIRNEGTLAVNGGTLYNAGTGSAAYAIDNYSAGKVTINGGTVDAKKASAVRLFYNNGGSVTVSGGKVGHYNSDDDCCYMGVQAQNGTNAKINITGGTISGGYALYSNGTGSSSVNISGGDFDGDVGFGSAGPATISISGGSFNEWVGTFGTQKGFISGGVFTEELDPGIIAQGKTAYVRTIDGRYEVGDAVAEIGAIGYDSLEAAFAHAVDGETIKLLKDSSGNGIVVPQGKFTSSLTVDFDGHTYTVDGDTVGSAGTETNGFQLLKDNKITFKNGKIDSTKAKILVQNYSDLTLDGMTLTLNNSSYSSAYTLSNNNGDVVINSSTINANPAGGFAFDVCRYASYPSVHVTVTGGSTINGKVEVSASGSDAKDGFGLTLTSGTLTGDIVMDDTAKAALETAADKVSITKATSFDHAAPEGYVWVSAGDNTEKIAKAVAKIGDELYASLKDAVAAVPADGTAATITMIDNEMINVVGSAITVPADSNITIDLNGYQVVGTAEGGSTSALITNKGTLTIKDGSAEGTGKLISGAATTWVYDGSDNYAGSYASNTITNSGKLTVESGYIENLSTGSATYAIDNNSSSADAVVSIKGGTVKAHSVAIRQFANSATKENTVNVSGGTVEAGYSGIWIQLPGSDASKAMKAALNVTGGTLKGGSYAFYDYSYGNSFDSTQYKLSGGTFDGTIFSFGANITISDGTYLGDVAIKQAKPSEVSVTGGRFSGDVYTYGDNASEGFITGGTFASLTYENEGKTYDDDWQYLLDDGYIYDEVDGFYVVRPANFVASVTADGKTKKYESFAEAFAEAEDGATITLLGNCSGNGIVAPQGKFANGLTVDFAGYTYTVDGSTVGSAGTETNGFQLLKDNKITFKNGTIASTKAKILVQNYSDLTLDGMTLTLNNTSYSSAYTLSNNNGDIVIDNTTINANPAGGFAFDVCRYSSYPSVNVTVTGGSTINGKVEVSASGSDAKDGFGLTLTSGTITGDIVMDATAKVALEATPEKVAIIKASSFEHAAPEGYVWVNTTTEGKQTIQEAGAKIIADNKTTYYADLTEALAAAEDGDTVILLKDSELSSYAEVRKNVVLDLNGKTITAAGGGIDLYGKMTVADSSEDAAGKLTAGTWGIWTNAGAELTVEKGTIEADNWAIVAQGAEAKVTITGGKVHSEDGTAISGIGNSSDSGYSINITGGEIVSDNDIAIYHPNGTTLSISGGTIQGATAIYQKAGTLEISGNPVIKATGAKADYVFNGNGANATGDAIVVESCNYPSGEPKTTISGGTFISANGSQVGAYAGNGVTKIPAVLSTHNELTVPFGELWIGEAGNYTLAFAEAYVDDTPYETLTEAINNCGNNNKLYLVKNHSKVELIGEYEKVLDDEIAKLVDAVYVDDETKTVSFEIVKILNSLTYEVTFQAVGNDSNKKSEIIATSGEGKQIKSDVKFAFDLEVPEALKDATEVMVIHKQGETVIKNYLSLPVTEGKVSFNDVEHFSEFEFSEQGLSAAAAWLNEQIPAGEV